MLNDNLKGREAVALGESGRTICTFFNDDDAGFDPMAEGVTADSIKARFT